MDKFIINTNENKISSINSIIRMKIMKEEHFDKITELSEKTGVSFNKIVIQCIEYAISNLENTF